MFKTIKQIAESLRQIARQQKIANEIELAKMSINLSANANNLDTQTKQQYQVLLQLLIANLEL